MNEADPAGMTSEDALREGIKTAVRPRAICANCNHGLIGSDIWYDHFCKKTQHNVVISPSTGRPEWEGYQRYPHCRVMNPKGECRHYEGY